MERAWALVAYRRCVIPVAWPLLLITGVLLGVTVCATMVIPRRHAWMAACGCLLCGAGLGMSLTAVWMAAGRVDTAIASSAIALGAVLGGFALAAAALPSVLLRTRPARQCTDGPASDAVHVIVLADAEPTAYRPSHIARLFADLEDGDIPAPPDAARILAYAAERARYKRIGGSPARDTVRAVAVRTSLLLAERGFSGHATVAFCTGDPSLAEAIACATADGARRIVVAWLGASESRALDQARREVSEAGFEKAGVSIAYTPPLWSSERVVALVVDRVLSCFSELDGSVDGIALVAEGQPWQWDRSHPAAGEQATYLSQRVRAELVERGLPAEHVRLAWLDWTEPGVVEVVRHLTALGCSQIAVVPATMPFDTIGTLLDLRTMAERSAMEGGIVVAVAPAWGDDPAVAEALAALAAAAADELPSGRAS